MHPKTENATLGAPKKIGRLLKNADQWEHLLLTAFALDDQESYPGESDPVHRTVADISFGLLKIIDDLKRWHNTLVKLNDRQPGHRRIREIEECSVCGRDCLPRPRASLCPDECFPKWETFRRAKRGDLQKFRQVRKAEIAAERAEAEKET